MSYRSSVVKPDAALVPARYGHAPVRREEATAGVETVTCRQTAPQQANKPECGAGEAAGMSKAYRSQSASR